MYVSGRIMSMLISHSHILDSVVALTKPQIKKKVTSEECTLGKFHVLPVSYCNLLNALEKHPLNVV